MSLVERIRTISGVGAKTEKLLNKLGILTKGDLLSYFPRTYDKYDEVLPIALCKTESLSVIYAVPLSNPVVRETGKKRVVICEVYDGSSSLELVWFNMPFIKSKLKKGIHYIFRGRVIKKGAILSMSQPEILTEAEYRLKRQALQPIYPLTKGITSNYLRKIITSVMKELSESYDYLPRAVRRERELMGLKEAVEELHFPKSYDTLVDARKRLVFDEFFLFSLSIDRLKEEKGESPSAFIMKEKKEVSEFLNSLPFIPTKAQMRAWDELLKDLMSGNRANRLIQGDVGSGKTLIAALACILTAKNGFQAALMAPTEILAKQHYENFLLWLSPLGLKPVLLTGSIKGKERKEALSLIESGEASVIIGTHALIQTKVQYEKLALVITDEQHRFGVRQREELMKKGEEPHVIVMSATPIPRTLAVILYGDLDISVIDELPAERLPIKNCVVGEVYRETSYQFIKEEVEKGGQAYIICPMIEENEEDDSLKDVISHSEKLSRYYGDSIRIAYLHGRMKNEEKNEIMEAFSEKKIDVLVSTTVVEVGVNVPNATVMMIENADRFGLASLHQLRGRIGRGKKQSYCIFMSSNQSEEALRRLMILKESNDGFQIAREDMELRGSGDIFGIRQSGEMNFLLGDVLKDAKILKAASEEVKRLDDKSKKECYDKGRLFYAKSFIYGDEIQTL